jgi:hypothetical protein
LGARGFQPFCLRAIGNHGANLQGQVRGEDRLHIAAATGYQDNDGFHGSGKWVAQANAAGNDSHRKAAQAQTKNPNSNTGRLFETFLSGKARG